MVLEVQWSVRDHGSYGWVPEDGPSWCYLTSFVVLGQIQTMVCIGELHLVLCVRPVEFN